MGMRRHAWEEPQIALPGRWTRPGREGCRSEGAPVRWRRSLAGRCPIAGTAARVAGVGACPALHGVGAVVAVQRVGGAVADQGIVARPTVEGVGVAVAEDE